ncbi:HAD-IA family hydrolase [Paenibacillus hexagrammi]|uniref:HAD-IA family hydrolase n=1 Tax=Paenibacillus hexagrammi TaxID=2908839 RepID=A0ABY3SJ86_9BACL|nr:HAD-IA family hydrolase [Paenibacillus sp. YPD9-1]UJF33205.1 HAD-IA family hydrolase [Paenibacillus sp. YPD9-1]
MTSLEQDAGSPKEHNGLWLEDEFLAPWADRWNQLEVISFDIFDTIVFRGFNNPEEVFLEVGRKALELGYLRAGLTAYEFQQLRILAEQHSRIVKRQRQGTIEVTLEEIYASLPPHTGQIHKLLELELDVEKNATMLNPSVESLVYYLSSKQKVIVLVSDMYLSEDQIRGLLAANSFPVNMVDHIFVSSEYGVNKSSSLLFEKLLKKYPQTDKSRIVHIGDNRVSDVQGAEQAGILAIHYGVIPVSFHSSIKWEEVRHESLLPRLRAMRQLASCLNASCEEAYKFWFKFGASILGPFLTGLCEWTLRICVTEGHQAVYPLMREGALLSELLMNSSKHKGFPLHIAPLYVSRASTFFAGIKEINEKELDFLFQRRHVTVGQLLEPFGLIDAHEFAAYREYFHLNADETKDITLQEGGTLKHHLLNILTREPAKQKVQAFINKSRALLVSYLQGTVGSFQDMVTIDMGIYGTIQKSLDAALSQAGVGYRTTHLLAMGGDLNRNLLFQGMDIRGYAGNAGEHFAMIRTIARSPEVLEELLMIGEEGSTLSYRDNGNGTALPVTAERSSSEEEHKQKLVCRDGIVAFQKLYFKMSASSAAINEEDFLNGAEMCKIIQRVMEMPTYEEAQQLGSLKYDENFGSRTLNSICNVQDQQLLEQLGVERFLEFSRHGWKHSKVYWPQGVVTRSAPLYILQKHLKVSSSHSYLVDLSDLVVEIVRQGIGTIMIYGAGDAGQTLMQLAKLHGLAVAGFVDKKLSLWGQRIQEVEVFSLERAVAGDIHVFAIGSIAFYKEIRNEIIRCYQANDKEPPLIFAVNI